jgi:hypothetical protein
MVSTTDPNGHPRRPKVWRRSAPSAPDTVIEMPWDADRFDPADYDAPPPDLEEEESPDEAEV